MAPGYAFCAFGHALAGEPPRPPVDPFARGGYGAPAAPPPAIYVPPVLPGQLPVNQPAHGTFTAQPGMSPLQSAAAAFPPLNLGAPSTSGGVSMPSPLSEPSPSLTGAAAYVAGPRRQLVGFLVSFHKDPLGTFYPLYAGANIVGRTGAADGLHVEVSDPATSSNHATIHGEPQSGRHVIEDMGSTNGTWVNDERLPYQARRELADGDRLRFGSYTVRLVLVPRP